MNEFLGEKIEVDTVSDKIIKKFLNQLSEEKSLEGIVEKLKKVVFEEKLSEASIRSAMFEEETS